MKHLLLIFSLSFISLTGISQNDEKRIALIIGNSDYKNGNKLNNPENDADLMSEVLTSLNFETLKITNASESKMDSAIEQFSKMLPDYNIALFYYAGHGLEVDGINYLIPTDAKLDNKIAVRHEAISLDKVVEEFEYYPNNTNIIILDACRDNPFRSWTRGYGRGFKAIKPSSGTIVAFATSEGETAADGDSIYGLYTSCLVKQIKVPQPIESVFKKTRVEVENISNGQQSPQEWTKLTGEFYFLKSNGSINQTDDLIKISNDFKVVKNKPSYGKMIIVSDISGNLYIDGEYKGYVKADIKNNFDKIKIGKSHLKIKGSKTWSSTVLVNKNETMYLRVCPINEGSVRESPVREKQITFEIQNPDAGIVKQITNSNSEIIIETPPSKINYADFQSIKEKIKKEDFSDSKLILAKQIIRNKKCFDTNQVIEIIKLFKDNHTKLIIAKYTYKYTLDKDNYKKIADVLPFTNHKKELLNFINKKL